LAYSGVYFQLLVCYLQVMYKKVLEYSAREIILKNFGINLLILSVI
jgi:hypothetical protein